MYVFNNQNELEGSAPVLLGQTMGDFPNMSDPDNDIALNATTPAGRYRVGMKKYVSEEATATYNGRFLYIINVNSSFNGRGEGSLAIHMAYPGEYSQRMAALDTPTPDDNLMSWGCINLRPADYDKFIKPNFGVRHKVLFILPDNASLTINPEDGMLKPVTQASISGNWDPVNPYLFDEEGLIALSGENPQSFRSGIDMNKALNTSSPINSDKNRQDDRSSERRSPALPLVPGPISVPVVNSMAVGAYVSGLTTSSPIALSVPMNIIGRVELGNIRAQIDIIDGTVAARGPPAGYTTNSLSEFGRDTNSRGKLGVLYQVVQ
jgi:hypothetical protein